ncbi:nucleotide-binding domain-containing protein [Methylobacterium brachiatum]|uniref:nucleotide-binding domain-containing protein n=1 Tax=Methylobacterium brachiatum TaxID=269660 RepID=UPI001FCD48BF|nr:nucleotidyltransferase [Methylobacterium brachiatum]
MDIYSGELSISIADDFKTFLSNIAVDNAATISLRYGEITRALNKKFRATESDTANTLQVGSYGRWTAIKGISDLDMLYIMPNASWIGYSNGGQSRLLSETRAAIIARYPRTEVVVDRLVVQVVYQKFHIEVQPVFEQEDGSFLYPDTYSGGSWKTTKPRDELDAIAGGDLLKNRNLRRLCKMTRAWKNKHGVPMGGLLIDSLADRFLAGTEDFDDKSYLYYDYMSRDFFEYLSELPKQAYFAALGSGQRVKVKKNFQGKAKRAYELSLAAIDATDDTLRNERWRKVFGRGFPPAVVAERVEKSVLAEDNFSARNTEEFIEDQFPVDIRYPIDLDCEITQNGFRPFKLRESLRHKQPIVFKRSLKFYVANDRSIPGRYDLYWKVLNRGSEAIRRDQIRGQIVADAGYKQRVEQSNFRGDHVVECYAVQNGVVVASDRIRVPIRPG